jgi:glycosyltransferase involved in cell wall biosynthesis
MVLSSAAMDSERISSARKPSVSAIIVCYNEEENIGRCLKSLQWCDEIVVIDSFSSDRTVEICRHYTDIVIQREWAGYRDQKAFAHSKATKDWVLMIDSDEEVTPELQDEIRQYLAEKGSHYAGFELPRLMFYLDRWWWRGGWYPDYDVRLFRRDRAGGGGLSRMKKLSSRALFGACEIHCIIFPTAIWTNICNRLIGTRQFHPRNSASKVNAGG